MRPRRLWRRLEMRLPEVDRLFDEPTRFVGVLECIEGMRLPAREDERPRRTRFGDALPEGYGLLSKASGQIALGKNKQNRQILSKCTRRGAAVIKSRRFNTFRSTLTHQIDGRLRYVGRSREHTQTICVDAVLSTI